MEKESPVEHTPEQLAEMKAEAISKLLEQLNAMPKGERSTRGRKVRKYLRKLGFYLSKQEKAIEEKVEA